MAPKNGLRVVGRVGYNHYSSLPPSVDFGGVICTMESTNVLGNPAMSALPVRVPIPRIACPSGSSLFHRNNGRLPLLSDRPLEKLEWSGGVTDIKALYRSSGTRDNADEEKDFAGVTGTISKDADRNPVKPAVILKVEGGRFRYATSVAP